MKTEHMSWAPPEFVLKEKYGAYAEEITEHASTGARVLVFGSYDGAIDGKPLEHGITPPRICAACESDPGSCKRNL